MTVAEAIVISLVLIGSLFSVLAAVGVVRMPDLYTRMHSSTKAGTLGVAFTVAATAVHFGSTIAIVEAGLVILFLFATAPIASHLIARAAYVIGVPLWSQTGRDDLKDAMDEQSSDVPTHSG